MCVAHSKMRLKGRPVVPVLPFGYMVKYPWMMSYYRVMIGTTITKDQSRHMAGKSASKSRLVSHDWTAVKSNAEDMMVKLTVVGSSWFGNMCCSRITSICCIGFPQDSYREPQCVIKLHFQKLSGLVRRSPSDS